MKTPARLNRRVEMPAPVRLVSSERANGRACKAHKPRHKANPGNYRDKELKMPTYSPPPSGQISHNPYLKPQQHAHHQQLHSRQPLYFVELILRIYFYFSWKFGLITPDL